MKEKWESFSFALTAAKGGDKLFDQRLETKKDCGSETWLHTH